MKFQFMGSRMTALSSLQRVSVSDVINVFNLGGGKSRVHMQGFWRSIFKHETPPKNRAYTLEDDPIDSYNVAMKALEVEAEAQPVRVSIRRTKYSEIQPLL